MHTHVLRVYVSTKQLGDHVIGYASEIRYGIVSFSLLLNHLGTIFMLNSVLAMAVPVGHSARRQPQLLLGWRPRRSLRETVVLRALGLVEGGVVLHILAKRRAIGLKNEKATLMLLSQRLGDVDDLRVGCCPAAGPPGSEPAPGTAASAWARRASTPA